MLPGDLKFFLVDGSYVCKIPPGSLIWPVPVGTAADDRINL